MADKKKVLIIDDEKDLCRLMKIDLESTGLYQVEIAYSGAEGLQKAEAENFDLVITDFEMPRMDGGKVLFALKKKNEAMPVVMFSIFYDDYMRITPDIRNKAAAIIAKPIESEEFKKIVKSIIFGKENKK